MAAHKLKWPVITTVAATCPLTQSLATKTSTTILLLKEGET